MTTPSPNSDDLSSLKRAILAIQELDQPPRSRAPETPAPVAVIGFQWLPSSPVVCDAKRFGGCLNGRPGPVLSKRLPERWNNVDWYDPDRDAPGKMNMRRAGFLADGIDRFDASFSASPA